MRIALYQPDIAGNVGTILRTAACFGVACEIIHPCGFAFSQRSLKRAGMDYLDHVVINEHDDFSAFEKAAAAASRRIVLLSSKASVALTDATFDADDIILMGSESAGVPPAVHERADLRIHIPMQAGFRSLNVAVAAGIALAEGLRQTRQFPKESI
jgi:tRNA (cytidine/uridine-2'-O-)-methyltransferase